MKIKRITTVLLSLIFLTGLGFVLYPTVSDLWNKAHQSRAIAAYASQVEKLDDTKSREMKEAAKKYNEGLLSKSDRWKLSEEEKKEYESLLDVSGTGIMGYIEIPKLNCSLPIYHGTDEGALQIAIGHLEGSSLPVGGEGTHCVLSGHRGLPSARLFTDLDQLQEGDLFILNVLDEKLAYEVDQIKVVLPDEMDALAIEEGKDLCTLVTCTPYGINSHRLLVRGRRVEYEEKVIEIQSEESIKKTADWPQVAGIAGCIVLIIAVIYMIRRKARRSQRR